MNIAKKDNCTKNRILLPKITPVKIQWNLDNKALDIVTCSRHGPMAVLSVRQITNKQKIKILT